MNYLSSFKFTFDHVRWWELLGVLIFSYGFYFYEAFSLHPDLKAAAIHAVPATALSVLAYLRNPKKLPWKKDTSSESN